MIRPKTKILVDGGDPQETRHIKELLGFVDGQTTNPTLIAKNPHIKELVASGQKLSKKHCGDDFAAGWRGGRLDRSVRGRADDCARDVRARQGNVHVDSEWIHQISHDYGRSASCTDVGSSVNESEYDAVLLA